jgi:hypothetical protein
MIAAWNLGPYIDIIMVSDRYLYIAIVIVWDEAPM